MKQIIIPRDYIDQDGKEQTFWQNSGRAFITKDQDEEYINIYFDALPFQPEVRVLMKELPIT